MSFLGDTGIRLNNPPGPSPALAAAYAPNQGGILLPVLMGGAGMTASSITVWPAAARGVAHRFICDKTGTLSDVSWWLNVNSDGGTYDLAVYDTGDTTPAVRTALYRKGATSLPATGWVSNNPNIAVKAGQHIDIGLVLSLATANAVAKFVNIVAAGQSQLPNTNYLRGAVSALPKLSWQLASATPWAGTQAEASCAQTANTVLIVATIT